MQLQSSKPRTVVALSGGVDSAVAAMLACERGDEVVAMTLRLYDASGPRVGASHGSCCAPEDIDDARRVAEQLGIPFYLLDGTELFRSRVIQPFIDSYSSGETPLPCVACNRHLKFGHLLQRARALSAKLCTGHYARIQRVSDGSYRLLRARDRRRDQTYFLYNLSQSDLAELDFPLGELPKDEVRALAEQRGLKVAQKPDSQEICFLSGSYVDYVERNGGAADPGPVVNGEGQLLGRHEGVHRFTVGQRRSLPIVPSGEPLYVTRLEAAEAKVVVGPLSSLFREEIELRETHYTAGIPPNAFEALVRIRHQHVGALATVTPRSAGAAHVRFREPVRAPAPGQSAVFYCGKDGEETVGGGIIR